MNNNEQKQQIRSIDVISVFVMMGLCILAAYPIIGLEQDENDYKALRRAEGLGYQLIEIHKNLNMPKAGRSIASTLPSDQLNGINGEIGLDPWGRTYQFEMVPGKEPENIKVVIWSRGENGKSESQLSGFEGDDIGIIVGIK